MTQNRAPERGAADIELVGAVLVVVGIILMVVAAALAIKGVWTEDPEGLRWLRTAAVTALSGFILFMAGRAIWEA